MQMTALLAALLLNIHDLTPQLEELITLQWLGEEVSEVVSRLHERHTDFLVLDRLAHEEVTTLNVFGALMHFRVVGDRDRRLVVDEQIKRLGIT